MNEADKDDEIVDVIIDEDGSIITVDLVNLVKKQQPHDIGCCFFSVYDFPKAEFEGYCRVGLIYTLH